MKNLKNQSTENVIERGANMNGQSKVQSKVLVAALILLGTALAPAQMANAPSLSIMPSAMPNPSGEITAARQRARVIFTALTGVPVSIDDARLVQMESLIAAGNERGAAAIATGDAAFYDVRLRDIGRRLSTRDELRTAPLSDFVATYVGVIRDQRDARDLLTGNFYYRADAAKVGLNGAPAVRGDEAQHIVLSNDHYDDITAGNYSLYGVLTRVDGQKTYTGDPDEGGSLQPITDAAGLISSRAFMMAHADAGTMRRPLEFSFRQFMCVPMESWMDASRPDDWIGRDVDRYPGGSNQTYQVTCKACHTQMDAFRGAFAYFDWDDDRIEFRPGQVNNRMNRNANVFPQGRATADNSWLNYAQAPKNVDQFGWRGPASGSGLNEFGRLLANSKGFSRCMARQLFTDICNRKPGAAEEAAIRAFGDDLESDYNLKNLAEKIVISQVCISK